MIDFSLLLYMMALVYAVAIDIGDVIEFPAAGWGVADFAGKFGVLPN